MTSSVVSSPRSDEVLLPAGAETELAGPAHTITPVQFAERISSLDILRGFALLGILVLNIDDFGLPLHLHDIPVGIPRPAFVGPHANLNLVILFIKWIFFEGRMRGLFSMLFGAGVVLLTGRAERRGAGERAADIFLRRSLWLVALGMLHGMYLWDGDILYEYGFNAVVFLYPFRIMKARGLFISGMLSLMIYAALFTVFLDVPHTIRLQNEANAIAVMQRAGAQLTLQQKQVLKDWNALEDAHKFTQKDMDEEVAAARGGYSANHAAYGGPQFMMKMVPLYSVGRTLDELSLMLIGMALLKCGFLSAELSYGVYIWTAIVGSLISIPLTVVGLCKAYASGFDYFVVQKWLYPGLIFMPARTAGTLAIAAMLLIVIKSGVLRSLLRPIAAVGQTALTNYLLTSVICQFLFVFGPWKLFGELEYYQLLFVLFGVWTVNLVLSFLWLRYFRFGPVEWLWRSLTYWKLQPMRLGLPTPFQQ